MKIRIDRTNEELCETMGVALGLPSTADEGEIAWDVRDDLNRAHAVSAALVKTLDEHGERGEGWYVYVYGVGGFDEHTLYEILGRDGDGLETRAEDAEDGDRKYLDLMGNRGTIYVP